MDPYGDGAQQGGRGLGSRLVIFIIIAFMGLMMYMYQVEENPITGERQHVAISPSEEIRLGLESAPAMSREMGGELPSQDPRTIEVQKIGNAVLSKGMAHKGPWKFQFHLLADPQTINAFALPGGQIFITLGLYNQLENEAELAGVLSHEIGHVIERHAAEQMASSQLGQILVGAVSVASDSQYAQNSAMVAAMVNQMLQLRYSRKDESEADGWGLKLMMQAGYSPYAMIQVMEVLKKASSGSSGVEIFQTHPNPDLRIEQIKEYLKKNPPPDGLSLGNRLRTSRN